MSGRRQKRAAAEGVHDGSRKRASHDYAFLDTRVSRRAVVPGAPELMLAIGKIPELAPVGHLVYSTFFKQDESHTMWDTMSIGEQEQMCIEILRSLGRHPGLADMFMSLVQREGNVTLGRARSDVTPSSPTERSHVVPTAAESKEGGPQGSAVTEPLPSAVAQVSAPKPPTTLVLDGVDATSYKSCQCKTVAQKSMRFVHGVPIMVDNWVRMAVPPALMAVLSKIREDGSEEVLDRVLRIIDSVKHRRFTPHRAMSNLKTFMENNGSPHFPELRHLLQEGGFKLERLHYVGKTKKKGREYDTEVGVSASYQRRVHPHHKCSMRTPEEAAVLNDHWVGVARGQVASNLSGKYHEDRHRTMFAEQDCTLRVLEAALRKLAEILPQTRKPEPGWEVEPYQIVFQTGCKVLPAVVRRAMRLVFRINVASMLDAMRCNVRMAAPCVLYHLEKGFVATALKRLEVLHEIRTSVTVAPAVEPKALRAVSACAFETPCAPDVASALKVLRVFSEKTSSPAVHEHVVQILDGVMKPMFESLLEKDVPSKPSRKETLEAEIPRIPSRYPSVPSCCGSGGHAEFGEFGEFGGHNSRHWTKAAVLAGIEVAGLADKLQKLSVKNRVVFVRFRDVLNYTLHGEMSAADFKRYSTLPILDEVLLGEQYHMPDRAIVALQLIKMCTLHDVLVPAPPSRGPARDIGVRFKVGIAGNGSKLRIGLVAAPTNESSAAPPVAVIHSVNPARGATSGPASTSTTSPTRAAGGAPVAAAVGESSPLSPVPAQAASSTTTSEQLSSTVVPMTAASDAASVSASVSTSTSVHKTAPGTG